MVPLNCSCLPSQQASRDFKPTGSLYGGSVGFFAFVRELGFVPRKYLGIKYLTPSNL